jgi:hypothetical protein
VVASRISTDAQISPSRRNLPYHIGNGWFGGMMPLLAPASTLTYSEKPVGGSIAKLG